MTNKITIDLELVKKVLKIEDCNCSIQIFDENIKLYSENDSVASEDMFSSIKGIVHDCDLGGEFLDIHRFKDMAIDYFGNKGWPITIYISNRPEDNSWGLIRVNDGGFVCTFGDRDRDYPNRLSAELAAINFIWEQIQREGKNA